jgi:hypothetical protein
LAVSKTAHVLPNLIKMALNCFRMRTFEPNPFHGSISEFGGKER